MAIHRGNILIAGAPGAGKSSVGEALHAKGFNTIDTDSYPGLSNWVDRSSGEIVEPPENGMDDVWLNSHDYLWDEGVLNNLLRNDTEAQIFYGSSSNQEELFEVFDTVFLLRVSPHILLARLMQRDGGIEYGKNQAERDHVFTWYEDFQKRYEQKGAVIIDADQPLDKVIANIGRLVESYF